MNHLPSPSLSTAPHIWILTLLLQHHSLVQFLFSTFFRRGKVPIRLLLKALLWFPCLESLIQHSGQGLPAPSGMRGLCPGSSHATSLGARGVPTMPTTLPSRSSQPPFGPQSFPCTRLSSWHPPCLPLLALVFLILQFGMVWCRHICHHVALHSEMDMRLGPCGTHESH